MKGVIAAYLALRTLVDPHSQPVKPNPALVFMT